MFSGGVIVPRETVHDERYDKLFADGERPQRLRFLLGRMISPLAQRLKTMKEVIEGLQAIEDWERNAHLPRSVPKASPESKSFVGVLTRCAG